MTTGKAHYLFVSLLALIVCGVIAMLLWLPTKPAESQATAPDDDKAKGTRQLEELHQKYARIRSVHLMATAKITIYAGGKTEGGGVYEYWAEDNRYRTSCHTDPQLELLNDTDLAFDGGRFYFLDRKTAMLSYRTQDEDRSFGALPNPFFLPVDFFSNDTDECAFCKLRLKDFKARSTNWDKQKDKLSVRAKGRDQANQLDFTDLELPGQVIDKKNSKFRVHVTAKANGVGEPTKIDRLQDDDRPLTSIILSDFAPTVAGDFPRRIVVQAFDAQSTLVMQVEYQVETLEINERIDNSVFSIKNEEAAGIWDSDEKKFVREKPAKKPQ